MMVYRDLAPEAVPRLAEALGVPYDEKASRQAFSRAAASERERRCGRVAELRARW